MKKQLLFLGMLISIWAAGNAQINFPDPNFKNALLNHDPVIDTSGDGEISVQEAEAVTKLTLNRQDITNIEGIAFFENITSLNLDRNRLTAVDISNNTKLQKLDLDYNQLTEIDLSSNVNLNFLFLSFNQLTEIDLSNNANLINVNLGINNLTGIDLSNNNIYVLSLGANNISEIDVSQNTNLSSLSLASNALTTVDVSKNVNLTSLLIGGNNLTAIDLSQNTKLTDLNIAHNNLTAIDLSTNTVLNRLGINGNEISTLDVRSCAINSISFHKNPNLATVYMTGQPLEESISLKNCPALEFICADEEHLPNIYDLLVAANQENCVLSSDCSAAPTQIQGTITYDIDGDGCDTNDPPFIGGLRVAAISLTNGQPVWAYPNSQGVYNLFLADDTYFIAPSLQNLNYYTFSTPIIPSPTVIPDGLAGLTTDYCIKALGNFNDVEITIIPLDGAVPGFEANYQITYTNIGTTTQSGTVTLDYPAAVVDHVTSSPVNSSNTNGQLAWDFTDLAPMESATINVTFILNTPTDAANPLNSGDTLSYTATVTAGTDETPDNNVMELVQDVVNSYDPNDKTCLEGTTLDPDDVGKYLHYLIRFENEGTADARNIRVTDVIDTTKLDIESFVPLQSSHSYTTTINNKNEIEFSFTNINLPFDDANNDGYVVFKIKSKDNLVLGDTIVNSAAIYFDFNFPIITEDEIVTVAREVATEPEFSDYFTLSPNPTTGILNLTVLDDTIKINTILIYDIGGNLVGFYLGNTRVMNVSYLFPNSYIMKINTDKGEFATQFIKL